MTGRVGVALQMGSGNERLIVFIRRNAEIDTVSFKVFSISIPFENSGRIGIYLEKTEPNEDSEYCPYCLPF